MIFVRWESADGKIGGCRPCPNKHAAETAADEYRRRGHTVCVTRDVPDAPVGTVGGKPADPDPVVVAWADGSNPRRHEPVPTWVAVALEVVRVIPADDCGNAGNTRDAALVVLKKFLTTPDGAT